MGRAGILGDMCVRGEEGGGGQVGSGGGTWELQGVGGSIGCHRQHRLSRRMLMTCICIPLCGISTAYSLLRLAGCKTVVQSANARLHLNHLA